MSIILEGIDLPEVNEIRMVAITSNGVAFFNTVKDGETSKSEKAKAIQIPTPHGRLVDIDKVKDKLRDQIPCCGLDMTYSNSNAFDTMDNAPTILEAEEK